jgi:dipeptidase D
VYSELFGQEPEETVLHAALEPCKMASRAGRKLDMIAFGPDVRNLHAPGEYVTISSCRKLWATLKALLAEL